MSGESLPKYPMRHLSDKTLTRLRNVTELRTSAYALPPHRAGGTWRYGIVYAAEDEHLQRRVALKVLELPGSEGELASR